MGLYDGRKACDGTLAAFGTQPVLGDLIDGVERRHLDQHVGGRRKFTIDKLEISQRGQEGCAVTVGLLPAFAKGKAQRGKEASQPVVGGSVS